MSQPHFSHVYKLDQSSLPYKITMSLCTENLFPALHFQFVCVPCFDVGLL